MLAITDLWKSYSAKRDAPAAVKGIALDIREGEFFTLLGPSGCGKTTTLRCIAGLETPDRGEILLDGRPLFSSRTGAYVPTNKRDVGMVFQSYAIWPHMTVEENVAFPLEATGVPKSTRRQKVADALALVGLEGFASRPATQLSGGQQQRVALARAIVKGARVLLLDEPLSNLDAKLREHMRTELRELQQRLRITAVYVTHDQDEALSLSDRVAVMREGLVASVGKPLDLYLRPPDGYTARFLGQTNVLPCTVERADGAGEALARTPIASLRVCTGDDFRVGAGERAELLIRPEHVELRPRPDGAGTAAEGPNQVAGTVASAQFSGRIVEYVVHTADGGGRLRVQSLSTIAVPEGTPVLLRLPPEHCLVLPLEPDAARAGTRIEEPVA